MTDSKMRSQELARALDLTAVRAMKMAPAEVITAFNDVEVTFLSKVSLSEELQLETKRRVAEWKFKLLSERDLPFEAIKKLYHEIRSLGFSNLENEGTIEIYFAQYCVRQSRARDAKRALEALCEKLDKALRIDDLLVYRHFREIAQKILSTIPK